MVATLYNDADAGCQNNTLAVLTGKGTGKFNKAVYYPTGSTAQAYEVFLADVNGDGKLDIVTSNMDGTISVLLNKGKGTFGAPTLITSVQALDPYHNSITVADFNGDGKADIAVATYWNQAAVYVLLSNGDGTFQAPIMTTTPDYTYTLAAGDFNKDGKMDLLVTTQSYGCETGVAGGAGYLYLQGQGNGSFTVGQFVCTGGNSPFYPTVGDLNGDGKLDAIIPMLQEDQVYEQGPVVLQGNGDGTFNRIGTLYVGEISAGAAIADFNGDGMPDIAVLNNDNYGAGNSSYVNFVTVMQNGSQPVSVSPLTVNYGSETDGKAKSETVILTNDQATSLSITSITVGGTDPGDFKETNTCGTSLKAGWECTITVKFDPTAAGTRSATLTIKDGAGTQTVQLNGTGNS
jgi:hypothetical protein